MSNKVRVRAVKRSNPNSYGSIYGSKRHLELTRKNMNTQFKYTILTYIFGNTEILRDPLIRDNNVEYICVTDRDDLKSNVWRIIKFKKFDDGFSNVLYVRYHPYEFATTNNCITIDGSFLIKRRIRGLLDLLDDTDLLLLDHPERDDLKEEINTWVTHRNYSKDHAEEWNSELNSYESKGLVELSIIGSHRTPQDVSFLDDVYKFCLSFHKDGLCERCDQVAFSYKLTMNELKIKILNHEIVSSSVLEHFIHNTMTPSLYGKRTKKNTTVFRNKTYDLVKPINVSIFVSGHESCKYAPCDDSYYYFNRSNSKYNDNMKKELNVFDLIKDTADDDDIVGLVQYRRYFVEDNHDLTKGIHTISRRNWITDKMKSHDVILAKKYAFYPQINSFRDIFTPVYIEDRVPFVMEYMHEFFLMIRDEDRDFGDFIFRAMFRMNYHFNDNLIICKKKVLMKYYEWFDDIAKRYIEKAKPNHDRLYTWMSEFIMGYWFMYNDYKIYGATRVQYNRNLNGIELPNCTEEEAVANYSRLPQRDKQRFFNDLNKFYEHNKQ